MARKYLNESKADALIWGMIHRIDNRSALRLFWTTSMNSRRAERVYELENFQLPELFWNDFREVLRLVVVNGASHFFGKESELISDQLGPFIQKVRTIFTEVKNNSRFSSETRSSMNLIVARSLVIFGEQTGKSEPVREGVALYRDALKELNPDRSPQKWAAIHFQLGIALTELGTRESGTVQLKSAMAAFGEALRLTTRERTPDEWAIIRTSMGETLRMLGERHSETNYLKQAVAYHREALTILTRERNPRGWAMTQRHVGNALTLLGITELDKNSAKIYFKEAVDTFTEALKEETRERVPRDWAGNQLNLGIALFELGLREPQSETKHLRQAVEAFRHALEVQTRERLPLDWARTQDNLGSALTVLGERQSGTTHLWEAVAAYYESLKEKSRERAPRDWAITQNNLGNVFKVIGERESGTKSLEKAVEHYHQALTIFTRENSPREWKLIQENLTLALRVLQQRQQKRVSNLSEKGVRPESGFYLPSNSAPAQAWIPPASPDSLHTLYSIG
jgi:tetratricopeptide (TPR) repeat protein